MYVGIQVSTSKHTAAVKSTLSSLKTKCLRQGLNHFLIYPMIQMTTSFWQWQTFILSADHCRIKPFCFRLFCFRLFCINLTLKPNHSYNRKPAPVLHRSTGAGAAPAPVLHQRATRNAQYTVYNRQCIKVMKDNAQYWKKGGKHSAQYWKSAQRGIKHNAQY